MDTTDQPLTLRISASEMEKFCRSITNNSSNTARKHAALIALEAFITQHSGEQSYSEQYHQLLKIIGTFSEETGSNLLQEYAKELRPALQEQNRRDIARIYRQVSRNGFHDLLTRAGRELTDSEYKKLSVWLDQWCSEAEQMGRQASGYPDAVNLVAAGIDTIEYQAMNDIRKLLEKR